MFCRPGPGPSVGDILQTISLHPYRHKQLPYMLKLLQPYTQDDLLIVINI